MTIFTILGFVATLVAVFALFYAGIVALLVSIDSASKYKPIGTDLAIWGIISVLFITAAALAIWQPLHWAGLA